MLPVQISHDSYHSGAYRAPNTGSHSPMTTPTIEQEIREQPGVLSRVLSTTRSEIDALVAPDTASGASWKRLHLVGCGDMSFAAQAATWYARLVLELDARAWRSMDLRWAAPGLDPDDLVVCASVSGRTPRTVEAARAARRAGARVIGLSDVAASRLGEEVEGLALLRTSPPAALEQGVYPGYHHEIAQTKTYTAALLAKMLAATAASHKRPPDFHALPDVVSGVIDQALGRATDAAAADWFAGRERVIVLGSGPHRGTALYGAAKFLEYAIPARAQCLEEVNHLDLFVADEKMLAIVVAPDDASVRRAEELVEPWERLGVRSLVVAPRASWPGARTIAWEIEPQPIHVAPFALAVALQAIAYRGAAALGRDPDAWLGGVRTEQMLATSQKTVRGSRVD